MEETAGSQGFIFTLLYITLHSHTRKKAQTPLLPIFNSPYQHRVLCGKKSSKPYCVVISQQVNEPTIFMRYLVSILVCVFVSPIPDSNRLIQQTGSECDRNVFSFQTLVGEAAVAPLSSSLFSAFSKLVIGMSSYVDPVLPTTRSFVRLATVKQQIK